MYCFRWFPGSRIPRRNSENIPEQEPLNCGFSWPVWKIWVWSGRHLRKGRTSGIGTGAGRPGFRLIFSRNSDADRELGRVRAVEAAAGSFLTRSIRKRRIPSGKFRRAKVCPMQGAALKSPGRWARNRCRKKTTCADGFCCNGSSRNSGCPVFSSGNRLRGFQRSRFCLYGDSVGGRRAGGSPPTQGFFNSFWSFLSRRFP